MTIAGRTGCPSSGGWSAAVRFNLDADQLFFQICLPPGQSRRLGGRLCACCSSRP